MHHYEKFQDEQFQITFPENLGIMKLETFCSSTSMTVRLQATREKYNSKWSENVWVMHYTNTVQIAFYS